MRNAFLVAWREYTENARTKGFWIGILMLPIILFLSFQIPIFLETKARPSRHFVLADFSREFEPVILEALEREHQRELFQALKSYARENLAPGSTDGDPLSPYADEGEEAIQKFMAEGGAESFLARIEPHLRPDAPAFVPPRRFFERVPLPVEQGNDPEALAGALRPWLRGEKSIQSGGTSVRLDAAVILPPGISSRENPAAEVRSSPPAMQYWASNLADKSLRNRIENVINEELRRREYLARGLDVAKFREIERIRIPVEELNPRKEEGDERVSRAEMIAQWAPVGFVYLLWIAIFSISQMLLNNTIEEKSNRIIEVLLSSVTPAEFVLGKLAGIAAVGLTMVMAWVSSLLALVLWQAGGQNEIANQFLGVMATSHLIPAFIVYFIFGYLLYAALILAVGSVCNTLKEAQNYMAAMTMLMVVPLLTMMFIPKDPHGTLATVLSWIPLYTPFIMMNRAAAHPPLFDLVGTMLLLVVTTLLALWLAVKIFRTGVLRTGQPPRLLEILKWVTQK